MQKSELLTQILLSYSEAENISPEDAAVIERFCDYAPKWLMQKGCLGVGYASTGMNLRFADGAVLSLFSGDWEGTPVAGPVAISGTKEKLQVKTSETQTPSIQITGR